jgi:DNA-binding transcriptional regulator GbsR (MarR family)
MAKATKLRPAPRKMPARTLKPRTARVPGASRPGGKLGLIVDRLSTKTGVTADELVEATGWQRHSVLGALSKLKSRGFDFKLHVNADRKAYRLSARKG